jgi:hypothetical protein
LPPLTIITNIDTHKHLLIYYLRSKRQLKKRIKAMSVRKITAHTEARRKMFSLLYSS